MGCRKKVMMATCNYLQFIALLLIDVVNSIAARQVFFRSRQIGSCYTAEVLTKATGDIQVLPTDRVK